MFEEGVTEAEHDQMRQASRADEKERRTRGIKVNNLAQNRECTIVVCWRPIRNSCLILQSTRNTEPTLSILFKK